MQAPKPAGRKSLDTRPDIAGGSHLPVATFVMIVLSIAVLYVGRDIIVPFALAILLSFILSPLLVRLLRLGLPRIPAVLLVVTFAATIIGGLGMLVASQLTELVQQLPTYQQNITEKIRALQTATPADGTLGRASDVVRELRDEVTRTQEPTAADEVPVVRLQEPDRSALDVLDQIAVPVLSPLGTAGIVVVLVIFMLLEREDLRNRLIRLGGGNLSLTTEAMNEVAQRVIRYLLMQLVVNATYAIPIGIGLYFIGVPGALLWGVLAMLLRFIPFLGPVIAAALPIALSIAVAPGWEMFFWTAGLFVTIELISNNFIEPWLYGSSTGVSALAIIMAAIFWTTLWGPVGLFLSTPLTVCLAVLGRYIPQLRFLDILLGSAPALSPAEHFYQRMLAGDPYEDIRFAEAFLADHSLADFYEEVAIPALRLAERDRQHGRLSADRCTTVTDSVHVVIDELGDYHAAADTEMAAPDTDSSPRQALCVAGGSSLDLAAAAMLAQLLGHRGIAARTMPAEALSAEGVTALASREFALVCICYLDSSATVRARRAIKRLRSIDWDAPILIGLWNDQIDQARSTPELYSTLDAHVVGSLRESAERIAAIAASGSASA